MSHKIDFKVGETVFIPNVMSQQAPIIAVVLSVGRKYVKAVSQVFHGTSDEKEMTFNIDLNNYETSAAGSHIRKAYQSQAQYNEIQDNLKKRLEKVAKLKSTDWFAMSDDQLEKVLEIIS